MLPSEIGSLESLGLQYCENLKEVVFSNQSFKLSYLSINCSPHLDEAFMRRFDLSDTYTVIDKSQSDWSLWNDVKVDKHIVECE